MERNLIEESTLMRLLLMELLCKEVFLEEKLLTKLKIYF
jgi:hypothetical protein